MTKEDYYKHFEQAFKEAILNMGWENYKKMSVFCFSNKKRL